MTLPRSTSSLYIYIHLLCKIQMCVTLLSASTEKSKENLVVLDGQGSINPWYACLACLRHWVLCPAKGGIKTVLFQSLGISGKLVLYNTLMYNCKFACMQLTLILSRK